MAIAAVPPGGGPLAGLSFVWQLVQLQAALGPPALAPLTPTFEALLLIGQTLCRFALMSEREPVELKSWALRADTEMDQKVPPVSRPSTIPQ